MGGYDKIDYSVSVVEAYRRAKGLSGSEVSRLFQEAGVFGFIEDFGDTLHCQSDEATISEIDALVNAARNNRVFEPRNDTEKHGNIAR